MVARALGAAGLPIPSAAPGPRTRADELRGRAARKGLRQSVLALFALSGVMLIGGAALYGWLESQRATPNPVPSALTAATRAELLVVADPWAHVFVNGHQLETTPFSVPLQLPPGTHHVRLEHPNAPAERRQINLAAGQHVLLEVSMKVQPSAADAGTQPALRPPDAGLASP